MGLRIYDRDAYAWRRSKGKEIEEQLSAFLEKVYRRSRSEKSMQAKLTALSVFCGFLRRLPNEILASVGGGELDPYIALDEFVSYLSRLGMAPHSIKDYVSGVKKWLRYCGVEVLNEKLREVAEMPRQYAVTRDRAPTKEELRKAVMATDLRGKALITLLASSGVRIGEALSLRVKDIEFEKRPVRVYISPEAAKDRVGRYAFISDEAAEILKQYLGERVDNPDNFVFQGRHQGLRPDGRRYLRGKWENEPMTYWNAVVIFRNALKKAGVYEEDDRGRDILHIHTLRKFFFTQTVPILGREITEALMGHKGYLDSAYRRFTLDQLGEYYLKAVKHLTILHEVADEDKIKAQAALEAMRGVAAAFGIDPMRVRIEKQRELGRVLEPEEEVKLLQEEIKKMRNHNSDPKKVISEEKLEEHLKEGWDVQTVLPSGRILIRKAQ